MFLSKSVTPPLCCPCTKTVAGYDHHRKDVCVYVCVCVGGGRGVYSFLKKKKGKKEVF